MQMKTIRFGIIGCGLMGREFASAAARWCHLLEMNARPRTLARQTRRQIFWLRDTGGSCEKSLLVYRRPGIAPHGCHSSCAINGDDIFVSRFHRLLFFENSGNWERTALDNLTCQM